MARILLNLIKEEEILITNRYFKSPMNYLGNKYKLLPQLLSRFPKEINNFYDVFCGGLDVSLNVSAKNVIANDKHEDLIWIYNETINYKNTNLGDELLELDNLHFPMNTHQGKAIRTYSSTDKNKFNELFELKKRAYYRLRDEFNAGNDKDFKIALLLMLNSFGVIEFRMIERHITFSCGKMRINEALQYQLNEFKNKINNIHKMTNNDFRYIKNIQFEPNDFVYLDPPYMGTSQYKVKWTAQDETDLYNLLDELDRKKVKFALSNFADGTNHTNEYLANWCGKYNLHNLNDTHLKLHGIRNSGKEAQQEILVTNY